MAAAAVACGKEKCWQRASGNGRAHPVLLLQVRRPDNSSLGVANRQRAAALLQRLKTVAPTPLADATATDLDEEEVAATSPAACQDARIVLGATAEAAATAVAAAAVVAVEVAAAVHWLAVVGRAAGSVLAASGAAAKGPS